MRIGLLTFGLALAAALPAAAVGPPASVKLVECSIEEREAAFYARMRVVDGSERMTLRFTLLERTGVEGFRPVKAPGLRRWHSSKPGVQAFGYRQGVRNLPPNASHRVRVDFRWHGADGAVVQRAKRLSAACRQFAALPNLQAELLGAEPTTVPGVRRYMVRVTNAGKAAASGVPVRLTVDGDVIDTVPLAALAPGESRSIGIRGPECDRSVKAEADPEELIAESSDDDNAHELPCRDVA